MALFRPYGSKSGVNDDKIYPGDLMANGVQLSQGLITTVGAGTLTGAAIASGYITRSGPTAAFTDTTDTAVNILAALMGNAPSVDWVAGLKFELLYANTVAQAMTFAAGVGVIAGTLGSGNLNIAASSVRSYLVSILNADSTEFVPCSFTTGTKVITFILPAGMVALPIGPSPLAVNITENMTISGTGITTGTKVLGVTAGQGGNTGVTTDTNTASTQTASLLTFGPTLQFDSAFVGLL